VAHRSTIVTPCWWTPSTVVPVCRGGRVESILTDRSRVRSRRSTGPRYARFLILVSSAACALDCEPSLTTFIRTAEAQVDALLIDYADLPAAQRDDDSIGWMRGELALIRDACWRGRELEAVWRIEAVQRRIIAAQKLMARGASCQVGERVGVYCVHSPSWQFLKITNTDPQT
jgi:hypothetical protein